MANTVNQIGPRHAAVYQYRVLHFVVRRTAVQLVQPPTPLRPVQPVIIINIAGAKWFHLRCRAGFSPTRTRRPVVARTIARTTVRSTLGTMRLSGLRCLAICLTKRGANMKRIFVLIMAIAPCVSFAAAPSTSCPSGYVAVEEEYLIISDGSCPSGYTSVGTADSCLVTSPSGACIMYAPAGVSYTDESGTYEYTSACPLE